MNDCWPCVAAPGFEAAYRAAHYEVFAPEGAFVMMVDQHSPSLAALMLTHTATGAAFISAANPRGGQVSDASNSRASAELRQAVAQLKLPAIPGEGRDPAGAWPAEKSLLIVGCTPAQARELGRRFSQNAILWIDSTAVPRLEWLGD